MVGDGMRASKMLLRLKPVPVPTRKDSAIHRVEPRVPMDLIGPEQAGILAGLFRERVRRSPERIAYTQYEETSRLLDADGWLRTGDRARLEDGHLFITGRLKDIIVLSNG